MRNREKKIVLRVRKTFPCLPLPMEIYIYYTFSWEKQEHISTPVQEGTAVQCLHCVTLESMKLVG